MNITKYLESDFSVFERMFLKCKIWAEITGIIIGILYLVSKSFIGV